MKTEPDIYAENPNVTPDYLIAVIQAAQTGAPVQYRSIGSSNWPNPGVRSNGSTGWDWQRNHYRIDPACKPQPPKIAEGNNPDNLTEDQVGVKDGWRLVTREEIESRAARRAPDTTDAQVKMIGEIITWQGHAVEMSRLSNTYRTKKPAGFFLPNPKVKVPLDMIFFSAQTNLWLQSPSVKNRQWLVIGFAINGLEIPGRGYRNDVVPWNELQNFWEYSTDRVNWKPCYKEVEQ